MTKVAILDYDAGNLTSVERAVRHLGGDAQVTRERSIIKTAERVIFPGVGAAGTSMESLSAYGLDEAIRESVAAGKPVLGICIGCQVILDESEEDGGVGCLGLIPGRAIRFQFPAGVSRKIPHMGWNEVRFLDNSALHPVFRGVDPGSQFYFVHSYHPVPEHDHDVQARATYGGVEFTAAIAHENLVAVQFHAEKSGRCGLRILENFLSWNAE